MWNFFSVIFFSLAAILFSQTANLVMAIWTPTIIAMYLFSHDVCAQHTHSSQPGQINNGRRVIWKFYVYEK